jgi:hypothetical protein
MKDRILEEVGEDEEVLDSTAETGTDIWRMLAAGLEVLNSHQHIPTGGKLSPPPLGPFYWVICLDLVVWRECREQRSFGFKILEIF